MAAVLIHSTYSPGPGRGILLNPSPAASPAFPFCLSPSFCPPPNFLLSPQLPPPHQAMTTSHPSPHPHLPPQPRTGSNPSTVRRIRFAPLPEPRRDLEPADVPLPPAFFDDDAESTYAQDGQPPLSVSSALAAATLSLAATGDSDLCRRTRSLPNSVSNSPCAARKPLPGDSLLLDPAAQPSSDANDVHPHPTTASSDLGQEWDVLHPSSSPALQALSLPLTTPDSPRKSEEPEFVEWGYGGMGSVKASAGQSQIWSRVQNGNVAIGNGGEQQQSSARTGAPSADEDDGSGMAWLKRRREQREREKKEREERERAEAEAQHKNATTEHGAEQEFLGSASSTPTGRVPVPEAAQEEREDTPMSGGARPWTESVTEGEGGEGVSSSATSTTSTASEDVDDSEDSPKDSEGGFGVEEEEEEEEEEDDEEEALLQERSRLTALGAGVEKIARHKEQHDHDHEMQQQPTTTEVGAEASR
ncbi:hypothetical protein BN946_scf185000.g49 [Trametes cinnabarina]|uniref:Uncharacterized protein n=1 Tax=Pycnoporus cinnabarinus TaxID=5643 RepID=A0A060S418_PYCCI|nr:hypothetical protein BN946_scf185000.g49 [Trametes cinnabarina]